MTYFNLRSPIKAAGTICSLFAAHSLFAATYCGRTLPPVKVTLVGDSITALYAGSTDGGATTFVSNGLQNTTNMNNSSFIHSSIGSYSYSGQTTVNAGMSGSAATGGHTNISGPTVMDGSFNYATFRLGYTRNGVTGDTLGYVYSKALNQLADHYVMGFGTNDARGKTGAPVLMTTQANIDANKEAYIRGWNVLLNGGVIDNYVLQGNAMARNMYLYPTWRWSSTAGAYLDESLLALGSSPSPRPVGAVTVMGFNQLPHAPHIFINKISWANPAGVGTDPLNVTNVTNVNNYFAPYSEQIAKTVGANSIDLYAKTYLQTQYYKDFVHPSNDPALPQRGDIWLGNWIGAAIANVQLPDLVPCAQLTGTFPVNTARNLNISLANLGKVASGSYKLSFDVVLPNGVKPDLLGDTYSVPTTVTNSNGTTTTTTNQYPLVRTAYSSALSTANPPLVSDPNKFICYLFAPPVAPSNTATVRCDALNNAGVHTYSAPSLWANDAAALASLPRPPLPNTPSIVPTSSEALSLLPGAQYPYNQVFFDIVVKKSATGFVAAGNNAKITVNYGGKEFARSNNALTFTIP